MTDAPSSQALLTRITEALERIAPPVPPPADLNAHAAYHWDGAALRPVTRFRALPLSLIVGVDRQKDAVLAQMRRHGAGAAAHDILLWGARGTGKSALVKAGVAAVQAETLPLALIEANAGALFSLPRLFALLADSPRRFILFIDDIAFDGDEAEPRLIRSMLEGGAEARPDTVRMIVTSNRRNIVARSMAEQDDPINARDVVEDRLALADRFGLKLGFQKVVQDDYLAMVAAYAAHFGLDYDAQDALNFAQQRGGQSGRTAWHYAVECAGAAGRTLEF